MDVTRILIAENSPTQAEQLKILPEENNHEVLVAENGQLALNVAEERTAELVENEKRLIKAQQIAHLGFLNWNLSTNEIICSDEVYSLYGIARSERPLTFETISKGVHPDDLEYVQKSLELAVKEEKTFSIDHRVVRPNGEILWMLAQGQLEYDTQGNPKTLLGTMLDITERKKAEKAIKKANRVYTVLSNINQTIVRVKEKQTLYQEVCRIAVDYGKFNMAWIGMLDNQTKQFIAVAGAGHAKEYVKTVKVDLNDPFTSEGPIGRCLKSGVHYLANDIANDPEMIPWRESALKLGNKSSAVFPINVFGKTIGAFLFYSDEIQFFDETEVKLIDELAMNISFAIEFIENETIRKQSEDRVMISEKRLDSIIEAAKIGTWDWNIQTGEITINKRWAEIVGYTLEELAPISIQTRINLAHPDDLIKSDVLLQEHFSSETKSYEFESRMKHKNGDWIWILDCGTLMSRDNEGKPLQMLGTHTDITKRKLAEEAYEVKAASLKQSEKQYKFLSKQLDSILDHIPGLIYYKDRHNNFIHVNKYLAEAHKLTKAEMENKSCYELYPKKMAQNYFEDDLKVIDSGVAKRNIVEQWQPEEDLRWINTSKIPFIDKNGNCNGIIGVSFDITERKETEEKMSKLVEVLFQQTVELESQNQDLALERENALVNATKYTELFNSAPMGYLALSKEDEILEANYNGAKLLGKEKSSLLKNRFGFFVSDDSKPAYSDFIERVFTSKTKETCEIKLIPNDKTTKYVLCSSIVLGNEKQCLLNLVDITERKQAELLDKTIFLITMATNRAGSLDELYRAVHETVNSVMPARNFYIALYDQNKNLLSFPFFVDEMDSPPSPQEAGNGLIAYVLRTARPLFCDRKTSKELQNKGEFVLVGKEPSVWLGVPLIVDGRAIGAIVVQDYTNPKAYSPNDLKTLEHLSSTVAQATQRKQAEEEIIKLNANLERKVKERTEQLVETNKDLQAATAEAERANLAKSEFLSCMSHELRTPMNSILGFAQLMEMGELTPAHRIGVNHILKSGDHLLNLINEVLDLSRIEAGQLSISPEPVELKSLIAETVDVIRPMATSRNIMLVLNGSGDYGLFVKADRQKLKQVLLNLTNNAVKFNRDGGSVRVEFSRQAVGEEPRLLPSAPGNVRISVIDTGRGIAPGDIQKLFIPFQRIGSEISAIEGTGLGLAVSMKLMEAMNGKIGVESEEGVGSTFWIELPEIESQNEHHKQKGDFLQTGNISVVSGTILYIEDNDSNIHLVEHILATQRPQIRLITDMYGKNVVKLATDYQPDIILLDLDLPDIQGGEVLRLLQSDPKTKPIKVVILSSDASKSRIEKLLNDGAKAYITKPLVVLEFLRMVDEAMKLKG